MESEFTMEVEMEMEDGKLHQTEIKYILNKHTLA